MELSIDHQSINHMLDNEPISKGILIMLKFSYYQSCDYYCPPYPANGSTYRIDLSATKYVGNQPVNGSEEWRAYLTDSISTTIRRFKTLGELNYFHKGMCGEYLF